MTIIYDKVNLNKSAENPFIVFEGPDGSGKSLVSKIIAKILGFFYYKTPPKAFLIKSIMKQLDNEEKLIARYFYYLSSVHYANCEVYHLLNSSGVICDRWIDSTQIYHKVLLGDLMPDIPSRNVLLTPSLIVVLDVEENIQIQRLQERKERFDKKWEINPTLLQAVRKEYKGLSGENVFHVSNNALIQSTIDECLDVINKHVFNV